MNTFTITDDDGDKLTIGMTGRGLARIWSNDGNAVDVYLTRENAQELTDWLTGAFELGELLESSGESFRITIPSPTGGEAREVRWSGEGPAPEWLQQLAGIALGVSQSAPALSVSERDVLRAAMGALGIEQAKELPQRLEMLRAECNTATNILLGLAGVTAGPDGVDLPKLGRAVTNRHQRELAALREQYRVDCVRLRREYDQQLGDELAREREVRAKIQQRLDVALDDLHRMNVELVGMRTQVGEVRERLDQRTQYLAAMQAENAELKRQLATAREGLEYVRGQFSDDGADAPGIAIGKIDEALQASTPARS